MNNQDPQNLTKSPETVSNQGVGDVDIRGIGSGTITFTETPSLQKDPTAVIDNAIASGDTIEWRIKLLSEALSPEQK